MNGMTNIFLLVGTNLGSLRTNLQKALKELKKNDINVLKKSKIHKTIPWGDKKQPDFLNMAIEIGCNYRPVKLLEVLKDIEFHMGRKKSTCRWGPRIIDLDILFYDHVTIEERDLIIPHKEFYKRPFAIRLLAEIAPDFIPPLSDKNIKDYLKGVDDEGSEIYCD